MVDANHTCFEQGAPRVFNGNNISEYIINLFRVSFVLGILFGTRTYHVAHKITSFMHWFQVLRHHWLSKSRGLTDARIFSRLEEIESDWLRLMETDFYDASPGARALTFAAFFILEHA